MSNKIITGIYCFVNKINHKKYVGQSINVFDRKNQHKYRYKIDGDSGYNSAFHSALRKYGWDNFSFYILQECSPEDLDRKEVHWIKKMNSLSPNGYNILDGGKSNIVNYQKYICPSCGKTKSPAANLCMGCYSKTRKGILPNNFKIKIPNNKTPILTDKDINIDLIDRILSSSLEKVAKEIGYKSGNSLKKRLISAGIPGKKDELFSYYEKVTGTKHKTLLEKEAKLKRALEHNLKYAPKKVGLFTREGNMIASYSSMREAARQTGVNSGNISEYCSGKRSQKDNDYWWRIIE